MSAASATDEGRICELEDGIIVETVVKNSSGINCDSDVIDWIVLDKDGGSIVVKISSDIKCDADIVDWVKCDVDIVDWVKCDADIVDWVKCDADIVDWVKCDADIVDWVKCDADIVDWIVLDNIDCSELEVYMVDWVGESRSRFNKSSHDYYWNFKTNNWPNVHVGLCSAEYKLSSVPRVSGWST